ncbi:VCBS repeat-containing protein [Candidatus Poribacteria bacterium]|nr:VCBS repeat-containing protein [Candidatus Poribacteria bacterium]
MQFRLVVCSCAIHYVLCCTLLLCCIIVVQGDQPDTIVSQDGAEMVLIPTTEFLMGTRVSDLDKIVAELRRYSLERAIQRNWFEDETPQHRVFIDAYYMDKYEVTNAQYQKFMEARGYPKPAYWHDARFNHPSQPVVGVSWNDAMAYAQWAGKTLPTEAQWENAARGGLVGKRYPWGDAWPPPPNAGNFLGNTDGYTSTSPVGSFKPNGYGIYDLVGNVAEWCLDVYSEGYYRASPQRNPINKPMQDIRVLRVVRGGGWSGTAIQLRCAYRGRDIPSNKYNLLGFRCVLELGRKGAEEKESREDKVKTEREEREGKNGSKEEQQSAIRKGSPPLEGGVRGGSTSSTIGFTDVTDAAGIQFRHVAGLSERKHLIETMGSGAVFFDYDNDGDVDLYVVNSGHVPGMSRDNDAGRNVLYRNNGDGTFTDVTNTSGTGDTSYGMGAAAADYDNDGDQDLYVTNFGPNRLFQNNGDGTFTDVTKDARVGDASWSVSCAFVDIDRDSDLDLYVVNYVEYDLSMKPCLNNDKGILEYCHPRYFNGKADVLYRNNGDGTFSDITQQAGVHNSTEGKGLGVTVSDYDNDGFPDIYVANDTTRNFLYRNRGDGTFSDVALISGTAYNENGLPEGGMGVDFGDYNNDGLLDLFVTNSSSETNTLYKNNGDGTFTDVTRVAGLAQPSYLMLAFGTKFFDYDNDGDLDLFAVNGHLQPDIERLSGHITYAQNDQLYQNNGNGTYTEISASLGGYFSERYVGRGAAFGDYDNDGDMDIFVVNSNQRGVLLRNDVGNRNNWIRIELVGTKSNRDGIGARVGVRCGELRQIPELHSGSSYGSGSDRRLLFGLGKAEKIQQIVIKWPSGVVQKLADIDVNQSIRIVEPD